MSLSRKLCRNLSSLTTTVVLPLLLMFAPWMSFAATSVQLDESYRLAPRHFLTLDTGRITFRDSGGNNPAVLLLHPMTGSDESWHKQFAELVGNGFRVIALSVQGAGLSGPLPALSHSDNNDIVGLLEHLGLPRVAVVGAAAGGITALRFTVDHPDYVSSLVISNSFAGLTPAELVELNQGFLPASDLPAQFKELGPSYRYTARDSADDQLGQWQTIYLASRSAKLGALSASERGPWRKKILLSLATPSEISAINAPVLLIYGGADLLMPPPIGRCIQPRFRDAQLVVIPEAGHAAHWEFPDHYNAALTNFLTANQHPRR